MFNQSSNNSQKRQGDRSHNRRVRNSRRHSQGTRSRLSSSSKRDTSTKEGQTSTHSASRISRNIGLSTPGSARTTNTRTRKSGQYTEKRRLTPRGSARKGTRVQRKDVDKKTHTPIPNPATDSIRIIPLGGVEEIGRNMLAIEFKDDIIIIDCGIQFKGEETPGIDYILPNTKYLEERKHKVRGIIITHGHLDHIGGIPYIAPLIGNPTIYTRNLTMLMIKKRQEEFPHEKAPEFHVVEKDDAVKIGGFRVRFFAVTHTIPDAMGIIVETPYGDIVHTGDLKLDHREGIPTDEEESEFKKFDKRNVLLLMADSTNVERPGFSIPEHTVFQNIDQIIKESTGRLIIGTFASQIERIARIIESAERYNKKIVIDGYSMKTNVEIAKMAKVLSYKKETLVPIREINDYPPHKIVFLVTGAQGDEFAVLMRVANKSHKHLILNQKDTVLLSSSIIPGNEKGVQKLKDNLSRQGAKIIHYQVSDVHSSGHANRDETKWIHKKIKPKFFMPIHGYHYMLRVHAGIAREVGMPDENIIIPDNGMIIEIEKEASRISARKETAPSGLVLVDGFSIGDIKEVVIRDRQMLAQDGMFVIVVTIDTTNGKIRKSPDLISRGFVYLRESQGLLQETRTIVRKTVEKNIAGMKPINFDYLKGILTDEVSHFLFDKTNKRPIVIPVILGI
jgi:ribonuclease J